MDPIYTTSARLAGSRKPGMSAAEYILESVRDPEAFVAPENRRGMPGNLATVLSPDEIRNVVAYLVSRGGTPDYDEIRRLEIPDLRQEAGRTDHSSAGYGIGRTDARASVAIACSVMRYIEMQSTRCLRPHCLVSVCPTNN